MYIFAALMAKRKSGILHAVNQLFMRQGIKCLTMDDIAKSLRVSKKTLYKFVSDKGDLVQQVMQEHCQSEEQIVCQIIENHENAIDELIEISKYVVTQLQTIHPSIHYDLDNYYPDAWDTFCAHQHQFIHNCVNSNLKKGIEQGYYRSKLNTSIIAKIYISRIDIVFDPNYFPVEEYDFADVYLEMLRYHIRGIASKKGMKYLSEKVKNEKLNFYP